MELMDRSLEELYRLVYGKLKENIPELVIGKMALSVGTPPCLLHLSNYSLPPLLSLLLFQTLKALTYLHDKLNVMHRGKMTVNVHYKSISLFLKM